MDRDCQLVARDIARLHETALNEGFLSSLGYPFLCLLYECILASKTSQVIFEYQDNHLVGFVSGGNGLGAVYKELLLRPIPLFLALFGVFFRPKQLLGIIEILTSSLFSSSKNHNPKVQEQEYELYSIVVTKEMRGSGLAERLYVCLCEEFMKHGALEFKILVGKNLDRANSFYKKMGACPMHEVKIHGTSISTVYVQKLPLKNN